MSSMRKQFGLDYLIQDQQPTRRVTTPPEKPSTAQSATLPSGTKDQEIESIKRTLYNAIDKLNKLTEK